VLCPEGLYDGMLLFFMFPVHCSFPLHLQDWAFHLLLFASTLHNGIQACRYICKKFLFHITLSSEKHKCQFSRLIRLLLTLINPVSVPQKIMSFAVNKLVILLPADSLPTFCCFSLNHIYHKFRSRIRTRESCILWSKE
jgi:hypothetical protein